MNTTPFARILVPTDLSEFANVALRYALLFQKKLGSQITLLNGDEFTFLLAGEYPIGYYLENVQEAKKRTAELLREYERKHVPPPSRVTTMVADETPARAIVMTADAIDADLIIMGTHGRHGVRRALLGSITERVLRETQRSVMTVRPQLFAADTEVRIGTILCPVNFSDVARQALEQACRLAGALNAELIVMNVSETDEASTAVEAQFSGWVDPLMRGRTRYEQTLVTGDPASRVLEVADKLNADLIVIGAQHKHFSDATVIGTTTERITRFARKPVLTVVRAAAVRKRASQNEKAAALA